jgi:hypothetical protein
MMNIRCKECGATKPHTEYYPKSGGKCKACYQVYYRQTRGKRAAEFRALRAKEEGMFTYTRQKHDAANIRYKRKHVANRMLELTIAQRNISEEGKELCDLLQEHIAERSAVTNRNYQSAQANTRSKANGSANPTGGAYMAGKEAGKKEVQSSTEEPDKLNQLKNLIYRWLVNAPTDDPAEIAPLIPAPVSMVRRIRTQMVEAGKLRSLDAPPKDEPKQESLDV